MAEVVYESLQHADPADLHAMAVYLKSLPASEPPHASRRMRVSVREASLMQKRGADLYGEHCAQCHGDNGDRKRAVEGKGGDVRVGRDGRRIIKKKKCTTRKKK